MSSISGQTRVREPRAPYIVYHLYADESPSGVRGEANEEREDKPNPDKENEDEWCVGKEAANTDNTLHMPTFACHTHIRFPHVTQKLPRPGYWKMLFKIL